MQQILQDDVFGTLTYDAKRQEYTGKISFGGRQGQIAIRFNSSLKDASEAERVQARQVYLALVDKKELIESDIVNEFLDLYNDEWRDDREVINRQQFLSAISLDLILIELGRVINIYYRDGELFFGHFFEVRCDAEGHIKEIELAG
jgi:hypothetical protein